MINTKTEVYFKDTIDGREEYIRFMSLGEDRKPLIMSHFFSKTREDSFEYTNVHRPGRNSYDERLNALVNSPQFLISDQELSRWGLSN